MTLVVVQCPEDDSSEDDATPKSHHRSHSLWRHPLLDIFASIAMFKDVDGTMSKFGFFEASVGNAAARIIVFFLELKCCFDGILLVVFWTIFVKSTNLRITVKIDLMS